MARLNPTIESTDDGSQTLIHPIIGDLYHSSRGAVGESMHIYIEHGLRYVEVPEINILECGFGSGLNGYLTMKEAELTGRVVNYTAIELYPISMDVAEQLEYASDPLFIALHSCAWGEWVEITPHFRIKKLECDLQTTQFSSIFDLVYYDAFAPDSQPELWSVELFSRLFDSMRVGGVLVTYTAKGVVKRALREVGFEVKRLPGALGKLHMLRVEKK